MRWQRVLRWWLAAASLVMVVTVRALAEEAGTQQPDDRVAVLEAALIGLPSLRSEVFEAYKALYELTLDVAQGRVSSLTALSSVGQWKPKLEQLWERLRDMEVELTFRRASALSAKSRESTSWEYGAGVAKQLRSAVTALRIAALGIEGMSTAVKGSDAWVRPYDQAGAYLELANVRYDLAGLYLTLMRESLKGGDAP